MPRPAPQEPSQWPAPRPAPAPLAFGCNVRHLQLLVGARLPAGCDPGVLYGARPRNAHQGVERPFRAAVARGGRILHGDWHLVDALHRHARLQPAGPAGLRRADHAAVDADRGGRLRIRPAHRRPRYARAEAPGDRGRADGVGHRLDALHRHGGRIRGGWEHLLAVITGGSSVPLVPAKEIIDAPMDFDGLKALASGLGTAAV